MKTKLSRRGLGWVAVHLRTVVIPALLFLGLAPPAFSAACIWDGTSGNWSDTAKWSCNVVPDSDDDVTISAGTVTLDLSTAVASLTMNAGTLSGANTLAVSGAFTWSGGTIALADGSAATDLSIGGAASLSTSSTKTLGPNVTLALNGATTWTSGQLAGNSGSVVVNNNTLTHSTTSGTTHSAAADPRPRFDNQGDYVYTGAGTATISFQFDNGDEVDVQSGSLILNGGGTAASLFTIASGATLDFNTGSFDLTAADFTIAAGGLVDFSASATTDILSGAISNAGTIRVAAGDFTFGQSVIGGAFEVSAGIAGFNQNTTIPTLNWTGGTIRTAAAMKLSVTGAATWAGSGTKTLAANSQLELNGATSWTSGQFFGNAGSVVVNNNTLTHSTTSGTTLSGNPVPRPRFDNQGNYVYTGAGTATMIFQFDNGDEVDIQSGMLVLNGGGTNAGSILTAVGTTLGITTAGFTNAASGVIGGNGTVSLSGDGVNYTNSGTFAPGLSPGMLSVTGNYTNSTLEIELVDGSGAGTGHDFLAVSGNAPLTGIVNVEIDAGFSPSPGQQFTVITCGGTCSGNFTTINVNKPGFSFDEIVETNQITLQVTGALPVELVSFEALVEERDILLTWKTQTETNNAGFEIQRAAATSSAANGDSTASASKWEEVTWIEGAGTVLEAREYVYRISDVDPAGYRFRLKQVDFDGTFEYSPVVEADVLVSGTHMLIPAYPNPFNPQATIRLAVAREQNVRLDVFDSTGRLVDVLFDGSIRANDTKRFMINGDRWSSGLYLYRIVGETFAEVHRMILIK